MREYRSLALTVIAIFIVTLVGAFFSPTFNEQKTYLELFFLFGALLFIFSILVIFAAIGFSSFSLYLAVFLAAVMGMYGVEGALLVTGMTYFFWGSIFAMEVLQLWASCDKWSFHSLTLSSIKSFTRKKKYKYFLMLYVKKLHYSNHQATTNSSMALHISLQEDMLQGTTATNGLKCFLQMLFSLVLMMIQDLTRRAQKGIKSVYWHMVEPKR